MVEVLTTGFSPLVTQPGVNSSATPSFDYEQALSGRSGGARRLSSRAWEIRIFNLVPRPYYIWEASHFCKGKSPA